MADATQSPATLPYTPERGWSGLIGGQWIATGSLGTFDVTNPATGEVVATVPRMGERETQMAIDAASDALPTWRDRPAPQRSELLRAFASGIRQAEQSLAALMTLEQGKPLAEALGEVRSAAAALEWNAEEARRTYGYIAPSPLADRRLHVFHQAIGVAAGITPWNFPIGMPARKSAPALAAGCTLILKPAEQTPLCALAFAEIGMRAGLPPGVLNVVTGDASDAIDIGRVLTASSVVRKLSFTGSTEVGRILMRQSAGNVKRLSLELGGNAPFMVFEDADIDEAVKGAITAKFRNAGQVCVAANRFLVHRRIHDRFVKALTDQVSLLRVGSGFERGVQIGPLIDGEAVRKVEAHVADALVHGATLHIGGKRHALGGNFFEPTVLTGVASSMKMNCEETFGPVAGITSFDSDDDGIALANASEYGLAAYAYTQSYRRAITLGEKLEFGMLAVNTALLATEAAPFGGVKQSGYGREGGREGIFDWMETKYLCMGGLV